MPQIGPLEILVVAAVALIVFGPEKLPEMARTLGRTIADIRRMANDIRADFEDEPMHDAPDVPEVAPEPGPDGTATLTSASASPQHEDPGEEARAGEAHPHGTIASRPEGARTREV